MNLLREASRASAAPLFNHTPLAPHFNNHHSQALFPSQTSSFPLDHRDLRCIPWTNRDLSARVASRIDIASPLVEAASADVRQEEYMQIVDEQNVLVGIGPRSKVVQRRCLCRGVYCLVFNDEGQILVTKRSDSKDLYPGHLDIVVSGAVLAGESYEESMQRELHEELGVDVLREAGPSGGLLPLFLFKYEDSHCRVWGRAFKLFCNHASFNLQEEEVDWSQWMPLEDVAQLVEVEKFAPVGLRVLKEYLASIHYNGATTWLDEGADDDIRGSALHVGSILQ